jgi:hypothetical protein
VSADNLNAMTIKELQHLQGETWERLSRIGRFERDLAEGADADYPAVCAELLTFARDVLNAQLNLLRSAIALAEVHRDQDALVAQIERVLAPL